MSINAQKAIYTILTLIAAGLLFGCLERHPYSYYILLRWVTCGTCVFGIYLAVILEASTIFFWVLGIIAIIFNPIIPVHMSRDTWLYFDVITGGILPVSSILIWLKKQPKEIDDET